MPPKMVWVRGESSEELLRLQKILETSLLSNTNVVLENEEGINKNFTPHITLGRIAQWQWSRLDPEEIPALNKDFLYSFNADSIKVMESQLKRGGAEYSILKSFSLNQS
jgi:2'-5' RNA ligase